MHLVASYSLRASSAPDFRDLCKVGQVHLALAVGALSLRPSRQTRTFLQINTYSHPYTFSPGLASRGGNCREAPSQMADIAKKIYNIAFLMLAYLCLQSNRCAPSGTPPRAAHARWGGGKERRVPPNKPLECDVVGVGGRPRALFGSWHCSTKSF